METCSVCLGTGKSEAPILIVDRIEAQLKYFAEELGIRKFTLRVHPFIGAYLTKGCFWSSVKNKWQMRYKIVIKVLEVPSHYLYEFHICDKNNSTLRLRDL